MNEEEGAALALLSRMRFACGDNGKRMQEELEEYLRGLKRDAERYRWLRNCGEEYKQLPILNYRGQLDPEFLDCAIDAAMAGANA